MKSENVKEVQEKPHTNEAIAVDIDKCLEMMDLGDLFKSYGPVELEVGSGKGTFLLNQSRIHKDRNYLGIEWANEFYRYSVDRMRRWNIRNVRVLRTDARDFIRRYVRDGAIEVLHIYFPDPWPKNKHHKRRFFQRENILQVHRILAPGGELRVATDHRDYFELMRQVMLRDEKVAPLFEETDFYPLDAAEEGELVGSNFERKYIKEGREFYKMALRKI